MKEALAMVEICVLCGWKFLNHFDIVSETPYSCDTVGCELWQVILCSLQCPETDWKIRIGKQGCVYFNYRTLRVMFSCFIPDINQCVNSYFGTGKTLIFR